MRGRSKRNRPEANSLGVAAPPDSSDEDEDNFSETSRLTSSCSNMDVSKASPTPPPTTRGQPQSTAQAPDATTTSAPALGISPTTTALSTVSQPSMMTSVVTYMLSFCETSSGSSDAAAAKSMEEAAIPCPLPEHADWARALIGSLGKDVSSVGRDFPRQDVKILLGGELAQLTDKNIVVDRTAGVQLISTFESTSNGDAGLLQVRPPHRQPAEARDSSAPIAGGNRQKIKRTTSGYLSSRDRVIDSLVKVVAIAESVTKLTTSHSGTVQGEAGGSTETTPEKKGGTSPTTPTTPGRGSMSARVMESVNRLIGVQDVDLNHSLTIAMMETELIYKNPDYRQGTSPPPPNAAPPIPGSGVVNTHRVYLPSPKCLAIDLLMCFNQGVIFFPSQRLKHLIWVSWTPHLHDLGWSCSFFRSSSHGADHVVVWHEQTIENNLVLLSDADRKNTPQFQLSWKLELVLSCRPSPQQQQQQQQHGAGGITPMPTDRKEGDESTTENSRDEGVVSSPTLLSTTATVAGQDDVETTQQFPCAFQTAMVTQATMDVTKWTWNEPPKGTKKSPLYQRRQGQFEQLMLDRFGLAPFYAQ